MPGRRSSAAWTWCATPRPDVLPAIVRRLDDAGLRVTELALRKPSLDEVFRTLTARPGTPEGALR